MGCSVRLMILAVVIVTNSSLKEGLFVYSSRAAWELTPAIANWEGPAETPPASSQLLSRVGEWSSGWSWASVAPWSGCRLHEKASLEVQESGKTGSDGLPVPGCCALFPTLHLQKSLRVIAPIDIFSVLFTTTPSIPTWSLFVNGDLIVPSVNTEVF